MGLKEILFNPTGFNFNEQNHNFVNPNTFSGLSHFRQRDLDWLKIGEKSTTSTTDTENYKPPLLRIPLAPLNSDEIQNLPLLERTRYNSKNWGPDFITRGNLFGLTRTQDDIQRLTKFFTGVDLFNIKGTANSNWLKNTQINGAFFAAKQNLLSALGYDGTIYLPTSTLAQAAISLTGGHIKKQGVLGGLNNPNHGFLKGNSEIKADFRKKRVEGILLDKGKQIISASPSYTKDNIEKRLHLKSGGGKRNRVNYEKGSIEEGNNDSKPLDKLNAISIYESEKVKDSEDYNDIIDFNIAVINNKLTDNKLKSFYIHFRAFLDSLGDNFSANWKSVNYVGRGEDFYRYNGFKRDMSLGFTLAALSRNELLPMYNKLNFLASSLAPSYSESGYMMGNLVKLTVGDYIRNQPGIINSLSVGIPQTSPWEINLPLSGENNDGDLKQLPHHLNIKMKFSPIHTFRPELATSINDDKIQRFIGS